MLSGKVVITEFLWEKALAILDGAVEVVYDPSLGQDAARLSQAAHSAKALVVRNQTKVTADLMDASPHLRVIGRLGAGLDNVDLAAARERQIEVVFAPEANAVSVAEFTIGLLLALVKKIPQANAAVHSGNWDRTFFTGTELAGKTLAIIGLGRIGTLVARRANALGLKVCAYDPRLSPGDLVVTENNVHLVAWSRLFAEADFVTVHVPLTDATRGLIGEREVAAMKRGACLINTARGEVVDEAALYAALTSGHLAGAALDVRAKEPPDPNSPPLHALDNVICTPHIAGMSEEAQARVTVTVLRDVLQVLRGDKPRFPADVDQIYLVRQPRQPRHHSQRP